METARIVKEDVKVLNLIITKQQKMRTEKTYLFKTRHYRDSDLFLKAIFKTIKESCKIQDIHDTKSMIYMTLKIYTIGVVLNSNTKTLSGMFNSTNLRECYNKLYDINKLQIDAYEAKSDDVSSQLSISKEISKELLHIISATISKGNEMLVELFGIEIPEYYIRFYMEYEKTFN
jgi:hypothetical protein